MNLSASTPPPSNARATPGDDSAGGVSGVVGDPPADAAPLFGDHGGPGAGPLPPTRVILFLVLAIVGATADLWTKAAIFRWRGIPGTSDTWWLIDGVLGIETAVNIGAVFGVGAGKGTLFAAFSVVAFFGILIWLFWFKAAHSLWLTWALGMVTGGIIGNLYDRLGLWWQPGYPESWQSGVRDWILFRLEGIPGFDPWPNFNIADSLLVVGACMLLLQSCFPHRFDPVVGGIDQDDPRPTSDRPPATSA